MGKIIINRNKARRGKDEIMNLSFKDHWVFIVDSTNHRLIKVNVLNAQVHQTGYLGSNLGQFNSPSGVMLDEEEAIMVADTRNNRLLVFSKDLKIVKVVLSELRM